MKKGRVVLLLLCLATLLAGVFCFAACGGKPTGKTDCEHEIVVDEAVAATCETDGLTEGSHCGKCGETIVAQQKINALGHDYKWTDVQTVSCTTDGIREGVCSHDATHTKREIIPAAHTPVTDQAVAATCLTAGLTEGSHCSVCNAVIVKQEVVNALGHKIVEDTSKAVAPTCTTHGLRVMHCANPDCDLPEIQEQIPSSGHKWDHATRTCAHGQTCTVEGCGATLPALNHAYAIDAEQTVEVDCEHDGKEVYVCENGCGDSYTVTTPRTGHKVSEWILVDSDEPVARASSCEVELTYRGVCTNTHCSEADHIVTKTETVERHTYKMTITTPATCEENSGVKTFQCQYCEKSYTETYTDENAHVWNAGVKTGGVTVYTCTHHSGATKKVVEVDNSGKVDKAAIESGNELKLEHAAIKLDPEAVAEAGIETDVVITADKKAASDLNISQELKEKIGDSPVFDFTMADASGNPISQFGEVDADGNLVRGGKVTVTLPYTLAADEDPDCIEIWYISDEGQPDYYKATYSNGFVSFETTHFSTYTVVRMSPLERCERYGHNNRLMNSVQATCTTNGYEQWMCTRCGKTELKNQQPALGHDPQLKGEAVAATCTVQGTAEYACSHDGCDYGYIVITAAIGHNWLPVDKLCVQATCRQAGKAVFECEHCKESYTQTLMQLQHNFKEVKTAPTCTAGGYSTFTCSACAYSYVGAFKDALGHNYAETVVAPTCTADGYTLHACANCGNEFKTDITPKSHSWDIEVPTCGQGQKCLVCGADGLPATGAHDMGSNGVCKVCGTGCNHDFETTTVAATCTTRGYTLKICKVCKIEEKTDFTPALGHEGTTECVRCGASLLPEGFFKNALESLLKSQIALKAENVSIAMGTEGEIAIDFAEFFFRYDDENGLYAYGYGTYETLQEDLPTAVTGYAQALIKDGMVYVKVQGPFGSNSANSFANTSMSQNIIMPFEDLIGLMKQDSSSSLPITRETIETVLAWFDEDFMPVIKTVEAFAGDELKGLGKKLTNSLITIEKKSNGYVISFNADTIAALNDNLYNHTIAENVDLFLGEGGFEKVVETVAKVADTTVQEILELAVRKGLKFKDLFAAADILVDKLMNAPGTAPEQKITLAMLVGQMMGSNEPIDPNDFITGEQFAQIRAMTVLDLVNALMPSDSAPQPGPEPSLPDTPEPDVPVEKTLAENESESRELTVEQITAMLNQIGEMNVYQLLAGSFIGEEFDEEELAAFKEQVDGMLDGFLSAVTVKVNTAANGAIENVSVVLDDFFAAQIGSNETDKLIIDGSLTITNEYESSRDYLAFETEQKNIHANIKMTEQVAKAIFGNDVTLDFYGTGDNKTVKTVTGTRVTNDVNEVGRIYYSNGYDRDKEAYIIFTRTTTQNYTVSFAENLSIMFASDCGGWIQLQIMGRKTYEVTTEIELSVVDEKGNPIDVSQYPDLQEQVKEYEEMYKQKDEEPYGGESVNSYNLWYNTATNGYEVPKDNGSFYGKTKHNYVEVGTPIAPKGCTGWGETYYSCTDCGDSYTLYTCYGHRYATFVTLKAGSDNCFDGVDCEYKCVFCGEKPKYGNMDFATPEEQQHIFGVTKVIDLTQYGIDERILIYGCACGESFGRYHYEYRSDVVEITQQRGNEYQANYVYNFVYGRQKVNSLRVFTFADDYRIAVKLFMNETGCDVNCLITYECDEKGENGKKIYEGVIGQYHNAAGFVVLDEGSKTCEDGYHVEYRCIDCDLLVGTERGGNSHNHGIVEVIDLAPYGAKCGEKLLIQGCACGEYFDAIREYNIKDFIYSAKQSDIQPYEIYYNGWNDYQYIYRCAVTDPKCDLVFSVKVYMEDNDCKIYMDIFACNDDGTPTETPYTKTFVVGYNHRFMEVAGSRKPVSGETCLFEVDFRCEVCGVIESRKETDHVRDENGEFITEKEYVNGSPCEYVLICTACHEPVSGIYSDHAPQVDEEPTCSQFGHASCAKCGKEWELQPGHDWEWHPEYNDWNVQPGHNWEWNEDLQIYVCAVCGLKNQNGASGFIVLEEVSAQGDDTVVIGYCFRNYDSNRQDYYEIGYEPMIVVNLYTCDVNEETGEPIEGTRHIADYRLPQIVPVRYNESEGNYISFFRSEIEQWMAENEPEYADWTISVTFVPQGMEMDLEYSIELD